jgi:hypothetical protein
VPGVTGIAMVPLRPEQGRAATVRARGGHRGRGRQRKAQAGRENSTPRSLSVRQSNPFSFFAPAGLAVGLALKEIALRRDSGDSPLGPLSAPTGSPLPRRRDARRFGWVYVGAADYHGLQDLCHEEDFSNARRLR